MGLFSPKKENEVSAVVTTEIDSNGRTKDGDLDENEMLEVYNEQSSVLKFTPSGGSQCQQSSRFIMWILFICTCAVVALVSRGFARLRNAFDTEVTDTDEFYTWHSTSRNSSADLALNASYTAKIAAGADPLDLCDVPFFMDGDSNALLIDTIDHIDFLVNIFFVTGAIAATIYLLTKFCVTYGLSTKDTRNEAAPGERPVLDVYVGGHPETRAERRVRIFLRGETLGYMLAQGLQDVPLITFSMVYFAMRASVRGTKCAQCVAAGELCEPDYFSDIDFSVKLAIGAVSVSLLWNAGLLAERWVEFAKYKKKKRQEHYNPRKYIINTVIFFIVYIITIVSPMAMITHYYLGPFLPILDSTQGVYVVGVIGLIFWAIAIIILNLVAGIDPGEILSCPVLCCEIAEVACEPCLQSCVCCCC